MVETAHLVELTAYDPIKRNLRNGASFGAGLSCEFQNIIGKVSALMEGGIIRSSGAQLAAELGEIFRYRALFALLPEQCLFAENGDARSFDKPLIVEHLRNIGVPPDAELVSALKFICENFRSKHKGGTRKLGVDDVFVRNRSAFESLLAAQNGRCYYCGTILERGTNMHLDHIMPWHLGNDPNDGSNWQFLCEACNRGKGMFPYYSLNRAFLNWLSPGDAPRLTEPVRFAALCRDRRCVITNKSPLEVELCVVKVHETGCWILDNVRTVTASASG